MDFALQIFVCAALFVLGAAQILMALELGRLRRQLHRLPETFPTYSSHHIPREVGLRGSLSGYAVYVCRGGRWELEADFSTAGHVPSPPSLRGAYEGQVIRKESAPARTR